MAAQVAGVNVSHRPGRYSHTPSAAKRTSCQRICRTSSARHPVEATTIARTGIQERRKLRRIMGERKHREQWRRQDVARAHSLTDGPRCGLQRTTDHHDVRLRPPCGTTAASSEGRGIRFKRFRSPPFPLRLPEPDCAAQFTNIASFVW